jgi:protease I
MKPALIITGKNVQDHEYIYPYYRLQEAFKVDVAVDGNVEVMGQLGTKIIPNRGFEGLNVDDYQVLVIPGGAKCMEYLRQDMRVIDFIAKFHATGKVIGSICHAAQMLISAKIVKGKRISGYYSLKDDIVNAGATYVDEPCVVDGNIVTTAHYKHLAPWMKTVCDMALK